MAKLGDLVVRIGADTRDLNKSLGKVQRNMRSMTSNFTALGTQMTKAVTLPILGVGAMAIKSAADLEKMEVSFISLTGGAKQAGEMMQQLNEFTAKTPFQIDAVATSARQLIASGTGIGEVNEQLQFLGDIAATTGQPINEIAAIFAKVNAKGKVELENLNQLAERGIPVFKGLADATGLLPSELGAGAVTVQQFNDYLKSLSEEGGMANGAMERLSETATGKFSTALDNLKLAGAALAEDLLPIISDLLDYVVDLAQSFTRLSPETKKIILIMGGLAAAIGPLLIMIPKMIALFSFVGGPITAAVLAMTALTVIINDVRKVYGKVETTLEKANKSVHSQSSEVRHLVNAYNDTNISLKDKERILKRLEVIDSTHFSNLSAENTTYKDLVKNLDDYTKALRRSYLEKAFQKRGEDLFKQLADQEARLLVEMERSAKRKEKFDRGDFWLGKHGDVRGAKIRIKETLKLIEEFEAEKLDLLEKYASKAQDVSSGGEAGGGVGGSIKEVKIFGSEIERLLVSFNQMPGAVLESKKAIVQLTDALGQTFNVQNTDALLGFLNDFKVATDEIAEGVEVTEIAFQGLAESLGATFGEMVAGAQTGKEALKSFAKDAIRSIIALARVNVIANATSPSNIANKQSGGLTAPIFALIGLSALEALLANIPALASSGLAYGPTLAMVGDNKNAHIDPEVIAPISKLKKMMGASTVQVYGRISGDDIVISNSRASRDRNRF